MAKHNNIGKIGEEIAVKYLINNNFNILERNFNCREGEIDIICNKKEEIYRDRIFSNSVSCEIDNIVSDNQKIIGKCVTHEMKKKDNAKKIYFIEVKSKSVKSFTEIIENNKDPFAPEKNFSFHKKQKMYKAIKYYLFKNDLNLDIDCDIMLVIVYINEKMKQGKVKIYESVTLN